MAAKRRFAHTPLALALLAALPAAAQQATAPGTERIEVTGYRAAIESALAEFLPMVRIDAEQIRRVIINLIDNAF